MWPKDQQRLDPWKQLDSFELDRYALPCLSNESPHSRDWLNFGGLLMLLFVTLLISSAGEIVLMEPFGMKFCAHRLPEHVDQ